jgi:hypothetical protein
MEAAIVIRVGILVLNLALLIWVAQDARKRGAKPVAWGIVVFLLGVVGWVIYLIARSGRTDTVDRPRPDDKAMISLRYPVAPQRENWSWILRE